MASWVHAGVSVILFAQAIFSWSVSQRGASVGNLLARATFSVGLALFFNLLSPWWQVGTIARWLTFFAFLVTSALNLVLAFRGVTRTRDFAPRDASDWTVGIFGLALVFLTIAVHVWPDPRAAMHISAPLREGTWYVTHGGPLWIANRHNSLPEQKYALDLVRLNNSGVSRDSHGQGVEAFLAWGSEVVSPVEGRVVSVVDAHTDRPMGQRDIEHPAGNHVIIQTADGMRLMVAHLQSGSVVVHAGDNVVVGSPLGRVGNSGNSSEPHLHLQAMRQQGEDWVGMGFLIDGVSCRRGQIIRLDR